MHSLDYEYLNCCFKVEQACLTLITMCSFIFDTDNHALIQTPKPLKIHWNPWLNFYSRVPCRCSPNAFIFHPAIFVLPAKRLTGMKRLFSM